MNETRSALVVDDERDIRELLVLTLGRMGLRISTAANLAEARELLASNPYDLCITDMRLPDGNGIELVSEIARHYPRTPVAMITAFGSMDLAVEALKAGAFDFVSKPVDLHVLRGLVKHALELNNSERAAPPAPPPEQASRLLGASAAMDVLRATIAKVARSQAPVYILGESGVGKELVARTIHEQGARAAGPFVPVNCGAIPAELMESEFFGHKKGSFTGAHADQAGLFQAAHGGTLFLDEVAELPLAMQVKLLRAIQEKSVRPVGASIEVPTDVRILSATHKDLADLVADGRFRHDLYYRINVIELRVPPLRDRGGDLPQLAAAILARLAKSHGRATPLLSPSALDALNRYAFPGNVRELENILERALAMAEDDQISAADLHLPQPGNSARAAAEATPALPPGVVDIDPTSSALPSYIEQLERAAIQKALEENRWNKTRTAAQLGITFRALRYKLKKLGME
ncbi:MULTISPECIES: sigma-54-dependent transcriptional regulator [Xanthomonas translucens group]|uniref:Type 4 fimbriae expression regulatory protein PilR n=2 Tax=Xanthomonas translucens group TaxID=3390202 RepID=A0A0K2ZQA6_9XANT|nr:sigma-54 dependent transcriptional regulator [Xanthomonas translucens]MCC8448307.1 sigma-54 dependent transcriptional regulator [Xanthomonas translucens pv. translucens]UKE64915.1 sigma-54 dependent transcriptional regulator [Xanthomonas translucens pv. phlei]UNT97690.1 sigma-54-dependent Fis family transcriptional regulator [Xanthomonas translucens pv. translucens]UNU11789.1 sigma-54-dependent Fis family transcriptional regulator [Xanthomonas translucens pv. translucens]CCP40207.1 Type 4 f